MSLSKSALGAFLLSFAVSASAVDAPAGKNDVTCPNAGGISKMLTGICYSCMLPMRVFGDVALGSDDKNKSLPEERNTDALCSCDKDGLTIPGVSYGGWLPQYYLEATDAPYCFSSIEGLSMNNFGSLQRGHVMQIDPMNPDQSESGVKKLHYHLISFPLAVMLNAITDNTCNPGMFQDIDILQMSEIDPFFSVSELNVFSPEAVLAALPPMQLMCGAEVMTSSKVRPIESLKQCAGTWGLLYPQSGYTIKNGSEVALQSLTVARALSMNHKRGILKKTVGKDAMCGGEYSPTIYKQQYKFQQFFPHNEANNFHWIGEHPLLWGEWRTTPMSNTYVNLVYTYSDCCLLSK